MQPPEGCGTADEAPIGHPLFGIVIEIDIAMPLTWTIDPDRKLVTATAEGGVTQAELAAYLDAVDQAGALAYRKLFDAGRGGTGMAPEEMLALGVRMRASHAVGPMGALAIVVPGEVEGSFGRVLGILASAERPMRVFSDSAAARKWIDSLPE